MEARLCDVVVGKKVHGSVDVDNGEVMMHASRNYMIHASRREAPGMAEIHTLDTDIIYLLEGTATLMTAGTAVDATMTAANEIRIDGWLNLPSRRFNQDRPAEHFYHRAIRFKVWARM